MAIWKCGGEELDLKKNRNCEVFLCLQKQQYIWKVPNEDLQVRDEYNFHLKHKREFCSVSAWQFLKIPVRDNWNTVGVLCDYNLYGGAVSLNSVFNSCLKLKCQAPVLDPRPIFLSTWNFL
jgi:hypothetical protein